MAEQENPFREYDQQIEKVLKQKERKYGLTKSQIITREVIEGWIAGNPADVKIIFTHCVDMLVDFIEAILRMRHEAEDIAQDVFTHIWENRERIDPARNFKGYLFTIARTMAYKQLRTRKMGERFMDYAAAAANTPPLTPYDQYLANETAMFVKVYLDNLPPQRKRVYEMSRRDGKSDAEIAAELSLSVSTVRNHLKLTMRGVKDLLALSIMLFALSSQSASQILERYDTGKIFAMNHRSLEKRMESRGKTAGEPSAALV